MPKLATKYSRQIVESQVMIYIMVKKVLYIFTSLAIWCVGGEEWGNGLGRVLALECLFYELVSTSGWQP
jgi:hypothetical protein